MRSLSTVLFLALSILLTGCDESVRESYLTKSEAASRDLFAQGWLPEIIPDSSKTIIVVNDLDSNRSTGEFQFDPSDHDSFVGKLTRMTSEDQLDYLAYEFERWIFWISPDKSHCRYEMQALNQPATT